MNKTEEIIKRLQEENRRYTVQLTGDKKNKSSGFYILMLSQGFTSTGEYMFHGIRQKILFPLK